MVFSIFAKQSTNHIISIGYKNQKLFFQDSVVKIHKLCGGFRGVVLLFYQPARVVTDGAAEIRVVETVFYVVYKLLGGVGDKYVPAVGAVDAFGSYSGGNHHLA